MAAINATFRRKYGIPPKGNSSAPDSEWGFPLPPAGHPDALKFARAVLDRAHQATNFAPADVARQVAKARRIIKGEHKWNTATERATPWRQVRWVNAGAARKEGFAAVVPRKTESLREFFARVPGAVPAQSVRQLSETARRSLALRAPHRRLTEAAIAAGERLREHAFSDVALREAKVAADGSISDVLLIRSGPGNLGDRHYYPDGILEQATKAGVFEGARMYLDHPTPTGEKEQPGRSVRDLAGWYSDAKTRSYFDPELGRNTVGVFATFHPNVDDAKVGSLIRTCVEYAKRYPTKAYAGLSIMAFGEGAPGTIDGEEWNIVSVISQIDSVDMVTRAGAGGAIVPLIKESYRMSKTKNQDPTDVELSVDGDKVRTALLGIIEGAKSAAPDFKALLKEAGVAEPTDEQIAKVKASFEKPLAGLTEEAVDKAVDDATVVAEPTLNEGGTAKNDGTETDDEMNEDDIDKMNPAQLKAALKKARAQTESAKKQLGEANRKAEKFGEQANRATRERMADEVLAELAIPDSFVGRVRHELIREGYADKASMKKHVREFDLAFIRTADTAGSVAISERAKTGTKIDLQFGEEG